MSTILSNAFALEAIDHAFAEMLARHAASTIGLDDLRLLAATTLAATRNSHSCLDLHGWRDLSDNASPYTPEEWHAKIAQWPDILSNRLDDKRPLFYDDTHQRVYLRRFRKYEENIATLVRSMTGAPKPPEWVEETVLQSACRYFTKPRTEDNQQQAVKNSLEALFPNGEVPQRRRIAIITGGPGTGKTTVLSVFLALALQRLPALNVALAAPTGKAKARIRESVLAALEVREGGPTVRFPMDEAGQSACERLRNIANDASTLHKLLGISFTSGTAKFCQDNPLPYQLVILDESSMTSLQLMNQLLEAMPEDGALLLVGDKDQLPSVEAGTVFGDLVAMQCIPCTTLVQNQRSRNNPSLCDFATAVSHGTADPNQPYAADGDDAKRFSAQWLPENAMSTADQALAAILADRLDLAGLRECWKAARTPAEAFACTEKFKVLCAVHEGRFGTHALNAAVAKVLGIPFDPVHNRYGDGTPIIVTRNDSAMQLNNGDVGVRFGDKVHFRTIEDGKAVFRSFALSQLPEWEPAYALTIHKSQGSDYDDVVVVLPDRPSPVLTRELLYTAITRTKQRCLIIARPDIMAQAIGTPTQRWSGLADNRPT